MTARTKLLGAAAVTGLVASALVVGGTIGAGGTGSADVAWVASAGGPDSDAGVAVVSAIDGSSFVLGHFVDSATFGSGPTAVTLTSAGDGDVFLARYSPAGDLVWAASAGGTGSDEAADITILADDSVVVTGVFENSITFGTGANAISLTASGTQDIFVARYSPLGIPQWAVQASGTMALVATGAAAGSEGGIYVSGLFAGSATFGSGAQETTLTATGATDAFIASYTATGTLQWAVHDGGAGQVTPFAITAVPATAGGGVAIGGIFAGTGVFGDGAGATTLNSAGSWDGFVARYSPGGATLWAARVGGIGYVHVSSVAATADGGIAATGHFEGVATFENGGSSPVATATGGYDVFVARLDANGEWLWAHAEGGAASEFGSGVAARPDGGLIVVGGFHGTATFGAGTPASSSLMSAGDADVFVARYTAGGALVWSVGHGGTGSDLAHDVAVSPSGNAVITGSFTTSVTFPTDPPTAVTAGGSNDMFVMRVGVVPTRVGGADRYATAVALAQSRFGPGTPVVHIATGANFPDALVAGPAASASGGPVLLTRPDILPASTVAALTTLTPSTIVIVGGPGAVSANVATQLATYAPIVERIAGANRFATAAELSARNYGPGVSDVYIASGEAFADAVGGGAAASQDGAPMLLVGRDRVPAETAAELARLTPTRIIILGGPAAVSAAVETELAGYATTVVRRAGADRYATSVAISAARWSPGVHTLYLATGGDFPDALAATPAATPVGAAVLLSRPTCVPAVVRAEIERLEPERIVLVGGTAALSSDVMALITCPP